MVVLNANYKYTQYNYTLYTVFKTYVYAKDIKTQVYTLHTILLLPCRLCPGP